MVQANDDREHVPNTKVAIKRAIKRATNRARNQVLNQIPKQVANQVTNEASDQASNCFDACVGGEKCEGAGLLNPAPDFVCSTAGAFFKRRLVCNSRCCDEDLLRGTRRPGSPNSDGRRSDRWKWSREFLLVASDEFPSVRRNLPTP